MTLSTGFTNTKKVPLTSREGLDDLALNVLNLSLSLSDLRNPHESSPSTSSVNPICQAFIEVCRGASRFDVRCTRSNPASSAPFGFLYRCVRQHGCGHPIQCALQAVEATIGRLSDDDQVCIVTYQGEFQGPNHRVRLPLTSVKEAKKSLKGVLSEIKADGGTPLHEGWLHTAQQLAPAVKPEIISRIILLSDGVANVGESRVEQLVEQSEALRRSGIATSTYGLGPIFNETLITQMACGGHAFYTHQADDLNAYFQNEIDTLQDIVLRDVEVTLSVTQNGQVLPITSLSALPVHEGRHRLSDVLVDQVSQMAFEVDVPESLGPMMLQAQVRGFSPMLRMWMELSVNQEIEVQSEAGPEDVQVKGWVDEAVQPSCKKKLPWPRSVAIMRR